MPRRCAIAALRLSALEDPDGAALSAAKSRDTVRWQSEAGYDLVTITAPAPGDWQISGTPDPDNRALVVTDLSRSTNGGFLLVGSPV